MDVDTILLNLAKYKISWSAFHKIAKHIKDLTALAENPSTAKEIPGLHPKTVQKISRIKWDENAKNVLDSKGINYTTIFSKDYPQRLLTLPHPPYVLFFIGNLKALKGKTVAIVGSRKSTLKGREIAFGIAKEKASKGYVVISGLALGIDTYAHRGALETGTTCAVLGSSLDYVYPRENEGLFRKIVRQGVVVSTYFPTTKPEKYHFPERNSIIAALSDEVIVVEAGEKSGALITAQWAIKLNKPLYTCDLECSGNKKLMEMGASLIQTGKTTTETADPILKVIHELQPVSVDELAQALDMDITALQVKLMELEIEGKVRRLTGGFYEKA